MVHGGFQLGLQRRFHGCTELLYKMRTILTPVIVSTVNHDNCMRFKATTVETLR